jgi:hypothetical protein
LMVWVDVPAGKEEDFNRHAPGSPGIYVKTFQL